MSVTGANLVNGSVVRWNNSDRPTAYVSSTQLITSIAASDTFITGNASVTVFNPAPGGGTSNVVTIPITNALANASAASYRPRVFAPESIVAAFRACFKSLRSHLVTSRNELPILSERPERPRVGVYQTVDSSRQIWRTGANHRYASCHQCDLLCHSHGLPVALSAA